jgi:DNA-directed RNA polymerase specialized sigma24 family protein
MKFIPGQGFSSLTTPRTPMQYRVPIPAQRPEPVVKKLPANTDVLLEPLLQAAGNEQADTFLSQLITTHVEPVIKGVIRYKLHFNSNQAVEQAEADDICQEVTVQLLGELQKLLQRPEAHSISDVRGLAAVIAHRACSRWMRRQFPERHALKNRLHYLLTRQSGFALWQNEKQKLMAGFAVWQKQKGTATKERLQLLADDERLLAQIRMLQTGGQHAESSGTLAAIFNYLGGPVEFDELIIALAPLLGIRDQPVESTDQNENAFALTASSGERDTAWQVEKRIFLQRLWEEVHQLPLNQRAALLLNLRDAEGRGCIALFPAAGIATLRQLAQMVGMSAEEFSELWNELPLEDAKIAERLRLTRQQVINARKSARERLKRRLKGFI